MRRKLAIYLLSCVLIITIGFYIYTVLIDNSNKTINKKITETSQVEVPKSETEKFVADAKQRQEDAKKAEKYLAKMLGEESVVDFHFTEKKDESTVNSNDSKQSSARNEVMTQFFTGIKENEPELFAGAYDTTALMPAFSKDYELSPEGIEKEHLRIINDLSKNGSFTNGTYTFTDKTKGTMEFHYKDGSNYTVPFQLHEFSDGHSENDSYFVIVTPIKDILEKIK